MALTLNRYGVYFSLWKLQPMIEVSANRTSPMLTHIAQTVADIVHRAADIIAEHIFFTVTDGQCRFGKLDGHAGQRDQPHPEKGIRSAEADRRGHARDIAGTDYGGHGGHQRVERGNVPASSFFRQPRHIILKTKGMRGCTIKR